MKRKEKRSSVVNRLLLVVIVGLIGFVAGYVWHSKINDGSLTPTNSTASNTSTTEEITENQDESTVPADWIWYENKDIGFKFAYPEDWKIDNTKGDCSAQAKMDFNASVCPMFGSLSPQTYIDYQTKKYGNFVGPLVGYEVIQKSDKSLDSLYSQFKTEYPSTEVDGHTSNPSSLISSNGLSGFYVHQLTPADSDNNYVIQLRTGDYIIFGNRESEAGGWDRDQNDYTQYTSTVNRIISTVSPL